MLYTCPRCQKYQSKRKANVLRHMNRAKKCQKPPQNVPQNPSEPLTIPHNQLESPRMSEEKKWKCIHYSA